jgi:transaldolase
MPLDTLEAFRPHGHVRGATVLEDLAEADEEMRSLRALGIDLDRIPRNCKRTGIAAFAAAYDKVVSALDKKGHDILVGNADRQALERL